MVSSLRTVAAIASAVAFAACSGEVGDAHGETFSDPMLLIGDGGLPVVDSGLALAVDDTRTAPSGVHLQCTDGYDSFICHGGCPAGQGCCITGIRPTGLCTPLDECPIRCAIDCAEAAVSRSEHEGSHCLMLCTWLAPEPICRPAI